MTQSYVYDNTEVTKTGKTAIKTLPSGKKDELFEITPKHPDSGTWKKWVRNTELYEVSQ